MRLRLPQALQATQARAFIRRCTITAPDGGAVVAGHKSHARIERNTLTGSKRAIDFNGGRVLLIDSTVAGNLLGALIGDSRARSQLRVRSSTIANNGGVAISSVGRGKVRVQGPIISGACSGFSPDFSSLGPNRFVSLGGNVLSSDCVPSRGRTGEDVIGSDPLLVPLQDNSGPTETMLPGPGSPALDLIARGRPCRDGDQRGVARAFPCDAGAVEIP